MFGTTGCWRKWRSGSTTRTSCTYHRHLTGPNRKGIAFGENASKQDFCAIVEGDEEDFPYISLVRDREAAAADPDRIRFSPSILPPYERAAECIDAHANLGSGGTEKSRGLCTRRRAEVKI